MYKFLETVHIVMCEECGEIHIVDEETFDEMMEDGVIEFESDECDCPECEFERLANSRGYYRN